MKFKNMFSPIQIGPMNRHPFSYNLFLEFKNMYKAILENYASSMLSATSGRILLTAPW